MCYPDVKGVGDGSDEPFEIHLLKFPSRDLYDAYLDDPERRSLSGERAGIIANSDILVGTPGPAYGLTAPPEHR